MKINTVGKIILKNGQKVYKRFGAAVVLKIKLGTAAFADIVKSTSVTEEGSVPDAILVAQQQQLIGQQQETIANLQAQINSLNSAKIIYKDVIITDVKIPSSSFYMSRNLPYSDVLFISVLDWSGASNFFILCGVGSSIRISGMPGTTISQIHLRLFFYG